MKASILRALVFLRLVDPHDNNLSTTSIALIVVIVKLAMVQNASMVDISALLLALINMNIKKWMNKDSTSSIKEQ